MALIVLVAEMMIFRLAGLAALALHNMDLLSATHTNIIAQQGRSLILTVPIEALAETMIFRIAGQTATEISPYYTEIANNSALFFGCN
jgi:hypothetical protein